jgi:hypothetical protein
MEVGYISDLHLDFRTSYPILPGGDVLIIAGDLCEASFTNGGIVQKFADMCMNKYKHVLYVMGNHEHYNSRLDLTEDILRNNLPFTLLENQSIIIRDVRFICATLWTDMNKANPILERKSINSLSDFNMIGMSAGGSSYGGAHKFRPMDMIRENNFSRQFIKSKLSTIPSGINRQCIVTHHSPSMIGRIGGPPSNDIELDPLFHNTGLEDMIYNASNLKFWVHGHVHHTVDYTLPTIDGECRVLANPMGYPDEHVDYYQSASFDI